MQNEQNEQPAATKYLTIRDVMNLYQVSRKTVYGWIAKGIIKPYKIAGHLIRFLPDDVGALARMK